MAKQPKKYELTINTKAMIPASDLPVDPAPKPTKLEVIAAMVIRARENHERAEAEYEAKKELVDMRAFVVAAGVAYDRLRMLVGELNLVVDDQERLRLFNGYIGEVNFDTKWREEGVTVQIPDLDESVPEMKDVVKAMKALDKTKPGRFCEEDVRKKITQALTQHDPQRLLADPQTSTRIDQLLVQISSGRKATKTISA